MSRFRLLPPVRCLGFFCVAIMGLTATAFASSTAPQPPSQTAAAAPALNFAAGDWSSSLATSQIAEFRAPALPSAPAPSAGQYDSSRGGMWHHAASGLAFEGGLGFNVPESDSIRSGWNLQIGVGVHAGEHFMPLIEYQF